MPEDQNTSTRLTDALRDHSQVTTVQATHTHDGHTWTAALLDSQSTLVATAAVTTTPNDKHALAIIDAHLISADRPRGTQWAISDHPSHTTYTSDLSP